MQSGITLKDHFRETRMFNIRVLITLAISLLLLLLIIVRLIYLQIVDHELYTTLSEENRFFISAIPPTRGLIYDTNDVLLAQNLPAFNLELIPERIENIDNTIVSLGEIIEITSADIERFKEQMGQYNRFKSIPLRTRLSDEEVARIAVNRYRFPGVDIAARLIRHYPHGELTSHSVGYVGRINDKETENINKSNYEGTNYIGKTGIEKYYEDVLHGHVGVQQIETNAQGRSLRTFEQVPAEPGINLHLSVDVAMQKIAQDALGEESGSVVAIDPKTGNVLAIVSTPVFDPNLFVSGIDHASYKAYREHPQNPLFNRSLRGQYPPGSTLKPFWGLAGLEFGVATSEIKTFCPGWFSLPGDRHRYRDWKKQGHGKMDLRDAIVQSCDVYFYDLALTLGIDRMSKFITPFGFDSPTGIDITGELGGLMPTRRWKQKQRNEPWYLGETLIAGIGQGYVLTTPLQLASAVATLSRSGQRMMPRVVTRLENTNTGVAQDLAPVRQSSVAITDPEHWQKIIDAMKDVAHHWRGTAYRIGKDSKYTIAGKTGTAQVFTVKQDEEYDGDKIPKTLHDHALFIAFAPVEDPQIAIAVIVEHGGHGGSTAAPIAKKIMDYYLLPKLEKEAEIEPSSS